MFYLQPTFWLLVAFLIFVFAIFKTAKRFISSALSKYREGVITQIDLAQNQMESSSSELAKLKKETSTIDEICQKIINSSITEANKIEIEGRNEIEAYLTFKERYIEEKIKIFTRQKIHSIKALVLENSVNLVNLYLLKHNKNKEIDLAEMKTILK